VRLSEKLLKKQIGNGLAYGELNCHVTLKGEGHDPNTFMAQYHENIWKFCRATIAYC